MRKFLITWVKLFTLFLVIYFFMSVIHESSHALVCKLNGFNPSLVQIMPHPEVNCDGIVNEGGLAVSPFLYFIFAIIPYILWFFVLIVFFFLKENKLVFAIVFIILLDVNYNYFISPIRMTDFTRLAIVNSKLFMFSFIMVLLETFIGMKLLKKNWTVFKKYIRNSLKK